MDRHDRKTRKRGLVWFSLIATGVFAVSQLSSYLVNQHIPLGSTVELNSVVHLTHIRNLGGVFGVLQGQGWLFGLISVVLIIALIQYLWKSHSPRLYEFICFGFIAGGGASNIADRLIYGSVIDYINLQGIPYWYYVFNTADVMIHIGLWPMLFFSIRESFGSRST